MWYNQYKRVIIMIKDLENRFLYHGTYLEIKNPNLDECEDSNDFGKGFYLTTDKNQAMRYARRYYYDGKNHIGILNTYMLSNFKGLNLYEFLDTDVNWLHCVVGFRRRKYLYLAKDFKNYEVIIGKIADDDTSLVLSAYMSGAYGEIGSYQAANKAIEFFEADKLKNQICLKSNKALKCISFCKSEIVSKKG